MDTDGIEYRWSQSDRPIPMGSAAGRVCFLTFVSGRFEGAGEWVHSTIVHDTWYLQGGSLQEGVAAKASCVLL